MTAILCRVIGHRHAGQWRKVTEHRDAGWMKYRTTTSKRVRAHCGVTYQ